MLDASAGVPEERPGTSRSLAPWLQHLLDDVGPHGHNANLQSTDF